MLLSKIDVQSKMDKFSKHSEAFQFALSPEGFLMVNHGRTFDVVDFKLFSNGRYYRRNGFDFSTDMVVSMKGEFLCSYCPSKFIAQRNDSNWEFATAKKALSEDFSLILLMRFSERLILLIADGQFANLATMVTLADTPSNTSFANALVRKLVTARCENAANMLLNNEEETNNVEE